MISPVASRPWPRRPSVAKDVAVDIGTATTQVVTGASGLLLEEPTVAAVDLKTGDVVEIGHAAIAHVQRGSGRVEAVWPLRHGVVDDYLTLQRFLARLLRPVGRGFMEKMRVVVAIPSAATTTERKTVAEATRKAGASEVHLVEQVVAAALGAGLPVHEPVGTMVVNVGAGLTEAGLLSLGSVVAHSSVRAGGTDVDDAIKDFLRRTHGVVVSDDAAELIKQTVGVSARSEPVEAPGELLIDGSTVTAVVEAVDFDPVVNRYVERVNAAVRATLVQAPPELAQDVLVRGISLAGGGAQLTGLAEAISTEFTVPVHVLAASAQVVALGAGKCAEAIADLKPLFTH